MNQRKNNHHSDPNKIERIVCPHPLCGFDANDPGSLICESCHRSLIPNQNLIPSHKKNNLKVVEKKSVTKINKKKPAYIGRGLYVLVAGGITVLVSVLLASMLNASPEAAIKKARGRIAFGGEPCSQRLINLKVSQAIEKLNREVRFRYTDTDRNKDQIQELIEGQIQIAFSEKAFLDSHFKRAKARGVTITAIPYAYDGIAYITPKQTKVRPLKIEELEDIFEGKITNWKQLGGEDQEIIPILMAGMWQNPMGIRLDEGLNPNTIFVKNRAKAKEILKKTEGAVFYTSATLAANELDEVNVISIRKTDGTVVTPVLERSLTNQEDIGSGKYPLVRSLNLIVNSEIFNQKPNNLNLQQRGVKAFVRYLVSPKGQAIVEDAGFVAKYEVAK